MSKSRNSLIAVGLNRGPLVDFGPQVVIICLSFHVVFLLESLIHPCIIKYPCWSDIGEI